MTQLLSRPSRRLKAFAVVSVFGLIGLAACGSGDADGDASSKSSKADSSAPLFKSLPDDIQKSGKIRLGSAIDYPPFEYYDEDGKTLLGFEVELADQMEKHLGVNFEWNNASFDTLLASLKSGRYDIVYGTVNDTKEREDSFDFVYYLKSVQAVVVAEGNPKGIKTEDDLCGQTIAVVRGGIQAQYLDKKSAECKAAGKKKVTPLTFSGNSEEQIAVKQGRAAGMLENFPTAAVFAEKSGGKLELVPDLQIEKQFIGMVLPKDSTELRDALQKAWQAIIDDGSYGKVLKKWGLSDLAIQKSGVNAVASGTSTD